MSPKVPSFFPIESLITSLCMRALCSSCDCLQYVPLEYYSKFNTFFWISLDGIYKLCDVIDEIFVNKVFTGLFSMSAVEKLTVSFLCRYFLLIFKTLSQHPHGIVCSIAFPAHKYNMTEDHPLHKPKPNVFIMDNV